MIKQLKDCTLEDMRRNCVFVQHPEYIQETEDLDRCASCSFVSVCLNSPDEFIPLDQDVEILDSVLEDETLSSQTISSQTICFDNCTFYDCSMITSKEGKNGTR